MFLWGDLDLESGLPDLLPGDGDFLFLGGGGDILDFFGSGDPESSDSSLSEPEDDDDSSIVFLTATLGGGVLDLGTAFVLSSRCFGDGSDSEELPSDSDLGVAFFLGLTGGGDTETGECCLFFGGGDIDGDAFRLRCEGEATCLTGDADAWPRRGDGERRRLGGEYLACSGERRLGAGGDIFLLL